MESRIEISTYGNMLIYKNSYSPTFVKNIINKYNLEGLRIFDHLDILESLSFLKEYNFLKKLDIDCINDQDYSFLKHLTNLKYLGIGLSTEEKKNIDFTYQINLEKLSIQWRKGKILGLENCQNIKELCLIDYKETDLGPINQLKKLRELKIKTASILTLNGIENFTQLEKLLLGNCKKLKSIKKLNFVKKLQLLQIEACTDIEDYDQIIALENLNELSLIDCKGVDSIRFLDNLPMLNKLSLLGNIDVLDGDLKPALRIKDVFYRPRKHYNVKIENKAFDEMVKKNLEKIKSGF